MPTLAMLLLALVVSSPIATWAAPTLPDALAASCAYDVRLEDPAMQARFDALPNGHGGWLRLTDESDKWCHSTARFWQRIIAECALGHTGPAHTYMNGQRSSLRHHAGLQCNYVHDGAETEAMARELLGDLVPVDAFAGTVGQCQDALDAVADDLPPQGILDVTPLSLLAEVYRRLALPSVCD